MPQSGPVLLVANHPNSLLDPAAVCAVAGRPVRFLAKAPLFGEPLIGWLVRSCGAIPIYRRQDNPDLMDRNVGTFRAAHEVLGSGGVVGIFPEGLSHSDPSLAPLKTGAARMALGAAAIGGSAFPIIPVGLILRQKERFRSRALFMIGEPVSWADLCGSRPEDQEVARLLTSRIEAGLRAVTINLERWEDAPVVECAEAIYAAEYELPHEPVDRVRRLKAVSDALVQLRRTEPERLGPLYGAVARCAEQLAALEIRPHEIGRRPRSGAVARWTFRQLVFFTIVAPLAALGIAMFFIPYHLTDMLSAKTRLEKDVHSTLKLLGGFVVYGSWVLLLGGFATWLAGIRAGVAALVILPVLALITMLARDRWEDVRINIKTYLVLRRRGNLRARLLQRRRDLAHRLEGLRKELETEHG